MKKYARAVVALLAVVVLCDESLTAWGDSGHEIVARLAARKLTATTKRRLVAILRQGGDDQLHLPTLLGPSGAAQPSA